MAYEDKDAPALDQFFGLRNDVRPEAFVFGDLEVATNVDIDNELKVRRRKGFATALITVEGGYHSLFCSGEVMVAAAGTALRRINFDGTSSVLRSGLTGARLSYAPVGPVIYYSDGTHTGCIDAGTARSWGLEPPSAQPVAAAIGGGLAAGRYQYAITYVRGDGQESGTGAAGVIELLSAGGIEFTAIPVPSDGAVAAKHLYISPVDGDALFRVMRLAPGDVSAQYQFPTPGTVPLLTQFKQAPIAGQALAATLARVFVARGRKLYWTDPYARELMDVRRSYTAPSHIVLVAAVDSGLYLGTGTEVIYLAGDDPGKFTYKQVLGYGAIAGTATEIDAELIDPQLAGRAVLFGTTQGVCLGLPGGVVKNLTKDRFQYPSTERGAAAVRAHGGMTQYLMVLEGTATAGSTAF